MKKSKPKLKQLSESDRESIRKGYIPDVLLGRRPPKPPDSLTATYSLDIYTSLDVGDQENRILLGSGRRQGAIANKAKAAQRRLGLRDAATYRFKQVPNETYLECIAWLQAESNLKKVLEYGKGKSLSVGRIKKIIQGTKKAALNALMDTPSPLT